jgi:hypothetical protein
MNTRCFVSGSSVILSGWLGATFLNEVPTQRYPRLEKKPVTAASSEARGLGEVAAKSRTVPLPTSVSR